MFFSLCVSSGLACVLYRRQGCSHMRVHQMDCSRRHFSFGSRFPWGEAIRWFMSCFQIVTLLMFQSTYWTIWSYFEFTLVSGSVVSCCWNPSLKCWLRDRSGSQYFQRQTFSDERPSFRSYNASSSRTKRRFVLNNSNSPPWYYSSYLMPSYILSQKLLFMCEWQCSFCSEFLITLKELFCKGVAKNKLTKILIIHWIRDHYLCSEDQIFWWYILL